MHVSYDIVDMRVAISFTDRMFHFLLDGHAHSQGRQPCIVHAACIVLPVQCIGPTNNSAR